MQGLLIITSAATNSQNTKLYLYAIKFSDIKQMT